PAATVDRVVRPGRLDAIRRGDDQRLQTPAREAPDGLDAHTRDIAGSRAWREDNESLAAAHAMATRGNALDLQLDDLCGCGEAHLCPSKRAARFHASAAPFPGSGVVRRSPTRGEPRSRVASSAPAIAAIRRCTDDASTASN